MSSAGKDIPFFILDTNDYWNLVCHCRDAGGHHCRIGTNPWYDVVTGPMAANWDKRTLCKGMDQIGFHTQAACEFLYNSIKDIREL
jgi:hypothetical protein